MHINDPDNINIIISNTQMTNDPNVKLFRTHREMAYLIAFVSRFFTSHIYQHTKGDCENVICIHTPEGQLAWHLHEDDLHLFDCPMDDNNDYDGCEIVEKYERLERLIKKLGTPDNLLVSQIQDSNDLNSEGVLNLNF